MTQQELEFQLTMYGRYCEDMGYYTDEKLQQMAKDNADRIWQQIHAELTRLYAIVKTQTPGGVS